MAVKKTNKKIKKPIDLKKIISSIWIAFIIGLISIVGILWATANGFLGEMPDVKDLENPDIYVSSEIISSDGNLLDRFETERRTPVYYKDLPPYLVDALLAKEDIRFFNHSGIDARATIRAVMNAGDAGGGSTITQQLAKQLFTINPSSNILERISQKLKEWVTAVNLERLYTKEEIIAMYFNKFDFLYGAKGIESAAKVYFNTTTSKLTLPQSATLVAMFRSPVLYNPLKYPDNAKQKRDLVIDQMLKYKKITKAEAEAAKVTPMKTDRQFLTSQDESYSAYYKSALRKDVETWLNQYAEETGKKYNLHKDGLKIYVTIDSRMQKMAEAAVSKHLSVLQKQFFAEQKGRKMAPFYGITQDKADRILVQAMKRTDLYKRLKKDEKSDEEILTEFNKKRDSVKLFTWEGIKYQKDMSLMDSIRYHKHILQAGLMSMDPRDGTVKAWVGGVSWDYFKFDHVKQARRQVGSTFKPIVYATAINQMGYTPCHMVSNDRLTIGNWSPKNANGRYGGSQDLRTGLAFSTNVITARLIQQTGVDPVIQLCRDLGIESPINKDYTIALGSSDLTVYEMVGALSTFVNGGIYIRPELIFRIEDKSGKVIKDYSIVSREVVNEYVAYTMIDLMMGVVTRGTGKRIRNYGITSEVAGKTGTTNDNSDGWFIGLTPNLVTGVWVGAEDRFAHFRSTAIGQGANTGLPIWSYYMKDVYTIGNKVGVKSSDKFEKPKDLDKKWDCSSLTGFHSYGDLDVFDPHPGRNEDDERHRIKASTVNDNLTEGNGIDFNQ